MGERKRSPPYDRRHDYHRSGIFALGSQTDFFLYRHRRYIRRMKQLEAEIEHLPPTLSAHLIHLHKINALWEQRKKEW